MKELDIPNITTHFYSDSTVVLGYIRNTAERFHTYVANRVETIRHHSDPDSWKHVPTTMNPADLSSRGANINQLISSRWFNGPQFLWSEPMILPPQPQVYLSPDDVEVKHSSTSLTSQTLQFSLDQRLKGFSNWNRAVRTIATIQKHLNKCLTQNLQDVERFILKSVQAEYFSEEIRMLKSSKPLKKSSSLTKLVPFLDTEGLLRIGGRLQECTMLSYDEKHPIILPKSAHVTTLLISHHHSLSAHQGREPTLAHIRSHGLWIVNAKSEVFKAIQNCVECKKIRGTPTVPQMATLPPERLEEAAPFTHCGIDCFGPFIVKDGRKERKTYGLMITCLASRAVHIELLEDMSSDSFINALRNLISIRGAVSTVRCDQGTNFIGAFNDLAKNLEGPMKSSHPHIKFTFNPPHSSHMGGVWERLIRSARTILRGIGQKHGGRLSTSQLRTFFYEVMAVINSRPLGSVSEDNLPLTPNMLLTMKSQITLPPPAEFSDSDLYSRKRWRVVQELSNQFWRKWRSEYLQTLQVRQKWTSKTPEVAVGDIVHVMGEATFRNDWSMARVIDIHRSHDSIVRSATLLVGARDYPKVKARRLVRPLSKIVVLVKLSK